MNTASPRTGRTATIHEIAVALRRGDVEGAQAILNQDRPSDAHLIGGADMAMRDRRWDHAIWLFDQLATADSGSRIKRCLCRNLACMQVHRPQLYNLLISLPRNDNVGIAASSTGHPTIVCKHNGRNIALSPENCPLFALASSLKQLQPAIQSGQSIAFVGLGDGYLLHQVAQKPPTLFMDSEQVLYVLEPDAHIVMTALMIHDFTGPTGAIEQPRVQWFVGPDWARDLRTTFETDLFLPAPPISLMLSLNHAEIQATLNTVLKGMPALDKKLRDQIEKYYDTIDQSELIAVFGENPPRPPRVLLITTRFSTVLQYATRDAAVGFQQAGWETRLLIEPTTRHRMLGIAMRQALADFKPDLVFQIDHLRGENPGLFPPNLPFACWIQDHLPALMSPQAGASVTATDFVLSDAGPIYSRNFGYPANQMISLSKLTVPPALMPTPASRGRDIIFVSNASGTRQSLTQRLAQQLEKLGIDVGLIQLCVDRAAKLFEGGGLLPTYVDVCQFLKEIVGEQRTELTEEQFAALARMMMHPVADALYRQQALRWVAGAARRLNAKLGLYGAGWEENPEFSQYARGSVSAGRELQDLTCRAAINLQIAPYLCLHQRLLDGICTGSFFLVREHITDVAPAEMLKLIEKHCGEVTSLEQARACVPPPVRDRFERLARDCQRCMSYTGNEDPIQMVHTFLEAQLLAPGGEVLPALDQISFRDEATTYEAVARFIDSAELRDQLVARQRESIVSRLTYPAAMKRIARRIGQLLPQTPQTFAGVPIDIQIGRAA